VGFCHLPLAGVMMAELEGVMARVTGVGGIVFTCDRPESPIA
jgi:hypothetical protein